MDSQVSGANERAISGTPWKVLLLVFVAFSARWIWIVGGRGDNGWTYEPAWRILHGQIPYRDFVMIPGPLAPYILAGLMRVFGESVWLFQVNLYLSWFGALAVGIAILGALEASREIKVLSVVVSAALSAPFMTGGHAHSYQAPLFAGLVIYFLLKYRRNPRGWYIFWAGIFAAVSILAKQNIGGAIGAAAVLTLLLPKPLGLGGEGRGLPNLFRFVAGGALGLLPVLGYFVVKADPQEVIREFFFDAGAGKGGIFTFLLRGVPRFTLSPLIPHSRLVELFFSLVVFALLSCLTYAAIGRTGGVASQPPPTPSLERRGANSRAGGVASQPPPAPSLERRGTDSPAGGVASRGGANSLHQPPPTPSLQRRGANSRAARDAKRSSPEKDGFSSWYLGCFLLAGFGIFVVTLFDLPSMRLVVDFLRPRFFRPNNWGEVAAQGAYLLACSTTLACAVGVFRLRTELAMPCLLLLVLAYANSTANIGYFGFVAPVVAPIWLYILHAAGLPNVFKSSLAVAAIFLAAACLSPTFAKTFVPLYALPKDSPFAGLYADPAYHRWVTEVWQNVTPRIRGKRTLWVYPGGPLSAFGGLPVPNVIYLYKDTYNSRSERRLWDAWHSEPPDFVVLGDFYRAQNAVLFREDSIVGWLSSAYVIDWQDQELQLALWRRKG